MKYIFILTAFLYHGFLIIGSDSLSASPKYQNNSSSSILQFIDKQAKNIRFPKSKEIVFIMGDSGREKTSLALLLTNTQMEAIKTSTEEFKFIDRYGIIEKYSSSISPGMITDTESGIEYIISPSSSIRSDAKLEIALAYFNYRIVNFSNDLKILFAVSASRFEGGKVSYEKRQNVREFVLSVTHWIRNIDEFKDGLSLVVTNVEKYSGSNVETNRIIEIAEILELTADDFRNEMEQPGKPQEEITAIRKCILFLETILNRLPNPSFRYSRIGIFRMANQTGLVQDIPLLQTERKYIYLNLHNYTKYSKNTGNDFQYPVSSEAMELSSSLFIEVQKRLMIDVSNIGADIKAYFMQQENQHIDLTINHENICTGYQIISNVSSFQPSLFGKQLVYALNALDIDLPMHEIEVFFNHIKLYEFLRMLLNSSSNDLEISGGLGSVKHYLNESCLWYNFVLKLDDALLQYDVQSNISLYQSDVVRLMAQFTIEKNGAKNINDTELIQFLDRISIDIHDNVENMIVSAVKMRGVKAILNQNMIKKINSQCSSESLFVIGNNVILSDDVLNVECFNKSKFINVVAHSKLFVDADIDKTGEGAQLLFIASKWEIIEDRKIVLTGNSGEKYDPPTAENGTDGQPGKPGGSGGHFVGIGYDFVNEFQLEIYTSGGEGGSGQNGGNGTTESIDPPIPSQSINATDQWEEQGFEFSIIEDGLEIESPDPEYETAFLYQFIVYGKANQSALPGGGCGGIGGKPGQLYAIGLERPPLFSNSDEPGENGTVGSGGISENEIELRCFNVSYIDLHNGSDINYGDPEVVNCTSEITSANGTDGANCEGIEDPPNEIEFDSPWPVINAYKKYVRELLPTSIWQHFLREILDNYETNEIIHLFYNTSGLVDELKIIEAQYFWLSEDLSFIPFVESLLNRVDNYVRSCTEPNERKATLKLLYTAILSKLCVIKNNASQIFIVDQLEYLEIIQSNVVKLNNPVTESNLQANQNQYKLLLRRKINSGIKFIKSEIIPEIDVVYTKATNRIPKLITNAMRQRNVDEIYDKRRKLENLIKYHRMLGSLSAVTSILAFYITMTSTAAETIGGKSSIAHAFLPQSQHKNDSMEDNKLFEFIESANFSISLIKQTLREEPLLFLEELKHIELELWDCFGIWKHYICAEVKRMKSELTQMLLKDIIVNPIEIDRMRLKLNLILSQSFPETSEDYKLLSYISNILSISYISPGIFAEIKNSSVKINFIAESINSVKNIYSIWMEGQRDIFKVIVPQIIEIQNSIEAVNQALANRNHVELEIPRGYAQNALKKLKLIFSRMTRRTVLQYFTKQSTAKIDESIAILIDILNRFDAHQDKTKFGAYFANVLTDTSITESFGSEDTSHELMDFIETNRVLEQYEVVMNLFRQYKFPFGGIRNPLFSYPADLKYNDSKAVLQLVSDHITYLKDSFKIPDISIGEYASDVFEKIDFSRSNSSLSSPFFLWEHSEIPSEVERLLSGEEIILKSDISDGLNVNAVKFNEVGVQFVLANKSLQNDFDNVLNKFHIRLTVVGNYYYRCGTKIYYISVDDNFYVEYSLQKDTNGEPIHANDIFRKVSERGFFLSPYALWKMKLIRDDSIMSNIGCDFGELSKYKNSLMDLKLVGQGQYFKNENTYMFGICKSSLDQIYHYDSTESLSNTESLIHQNA